MRTRISVCAAFFLTAGLLMGCGGGSSTTVTPPAISGTITGAPQSLSAGATATLTATVSNDSTNAGVDWSCTPAASCGSFSPTHTASGASTTYTAPATAGTVMIIASATANGKAIANVSVTINAAAAVTLALTGAPASLATNATVSLTATVSNDSTNAGVDWTCTPTGTCGSFNPTHTASGAATVFTAPAAAGSVTVVATSTASASATQSATITIGTGSSVAELSGLYAFALTGHDAAAHGYSLAGSVTLDGNGNVTAGEQDYNNGHGTTSPEPAGDAITSGTYTVNSTGQGTLTLVTNNSKLGASGTETFSLVVVNNKHVLLTQVDASGTASGTLDAQTVAGGLGQLTGTYSFTVAGANGNNAEVFGGLFTSNGSGGLSVIVDSSSNGAVNTHGTNTGTYTAPDASGRGTISFGGDNFVYYAIGPEALRLIVTDSSETDLGAAFGHGTGTFSNATLNGSYVFKNSGAETGTGSYVSAGRFTADSNGNITAGFADVDEAGTVTSAAFTGTYTLASNGYGSIAITPGNTQHVGTLGVYAIDPAINPLDPNSTTGGGGALILDLDAADVGGGVLLAQSTPATFQNNYAAGYRSFTPGGIELNLVGQISVGNTGIITGTADANDLQAGGPHLGVSLGGTLAPDNTHAGRFTLPFNVAIGANPPALNFVVYQASTGDLLWMETDATQYVSGSIEQQQ